MFRNLLEWWLRTRYGFPLVVVGAVALMVLNEFTYQHSWTRLTSGINLTDARIRASQTLQLVSDAETGVRSYMLTARPSYLAMYRKAVAEMEAVQEDGFRLIEQADEAHTIRTTEIRRLLASKLAELRTVIDFNETGRKQDALALTLSDTGVTTMTELRAAFDDVLGSATALQQQARVSLFHALQLNRLVVHLLSLAALVGLYYFTRQLRQTDLARKQSQDRLEAQVRARTTQLRELAGHLVTAREDERGRLARELHDELGGLFTSMKLDFARVRRVAELPEAMQDRVKSIERRLNDGIAMKRRIVESLRPSALDQLGLTTSVSLLCRESAQAIGIPVHEALEPVELTSEAQLTIYRLVQESLTNIGKYAQATQVSVTVMPESNGVLAMIEDDGCGFDPTSVSTGHHGLLGMRYRVEWHGGTMQIDSTPGRGTRITASLPAATLAA